MAGYPPSVIQDAQHLVFSSGGIYLVKMYGMIRACIQNRHLSISKIKSIYGTSAGAIIGAIVSMSASVLIDWDWMDHYFYNRDMMQICRVNYWSMSTLTTIYKSYGIYDKKFIASLIGPIFFHHQIQLDEITLEKFDLLTGIRFTCMATRYDTLESIELSAETHPTMTLLDALYATSCVPFIHRPYKWIPSEGEAVWYIDGGIRATYPFEACTKKYPTDIIFGVCVYQLPQTETSDCLPDTLLDYAIVLIRRLVFATQHHIQHSTSHQFFLATGNISVMDAVKCMDARRRMIDNGSEEWIRYMTPPSGEEPSAEKIEELGSTSPEGNNVPTHIDTWEEDVSLLYSTETDQFIHDAEEIDNGNPTRMG